MLEAVLRDVLHVVDGLAAVAGILVAVAGVFVILYLGFFWLSAVEFPIGIQDEAELVRHFERDHRALEAVVEEALAADVRSARRGSWSIAGRIGPWPDGREYEALFRAMRRAKVEEVWVRVEEEGASMRLITDTVFHMIDGEYFGYVWMSDEALEAESENPEGLDEGRGDRLDTHWFLYRFLES